MKSLLIILISTLFAALILQASANLLHDRLLPEKIEEMRVAYVELAVVEQKMIDWGSCKAFIEIYQLQLPDYYCNVTIEYMPTLQEDHIKIATRIAELTEGIK